MLSSLMIDFKVNYLALSVSFDFEIIGSARKSFVVQLFLDLIPTVDGGP